MDLAPIEALTGLILIVFLPGFAITRALFPERRVFRPLSLRTLIEQLTSSFILSVVLVILVAFGWLGTGIGVQAGWSNPLVEATLASIAVVALAIATLRGSFRRSPPRGPATEPQLGHDGALSLIRQLDLLAGEERRLAHRIRVLGEGSAGAGDARRELERVRTEAGELRRRREAEYAS